MKASLYESLLISQQKTIDDLEFRVSILNAQLSNTAKRKLDAVIEARRDFFNYRAEEIENEKQSLRRLIEAELKESAKAPENE